MNKTKLLELIYDKLADNDNYEQFNASDVDDMYFDYDKKVIVIGEHGNYWLIEAKRVRK